MNLPDNPENNNFDEYERKVELEFEEGNKGKIDWMKMVTPIGFIAIFVVGLAVGINNMNKTTITEIEASNMKSSSVEIKVISNPNVVQKDASPSDAMELISKENKSVKNSDGIFSSLGRRIISLFENLIDKN